MPPAWQRLVYEAIKEAGAEFGIVDFGMRALLSMRLEKNFPTWFRELRPIYGPFEGGPGPLRQAGQGRVHRPEAAAKREHAKGPKLRRVSFAIDAEDADVMGDEPIWARSDATNYVVESPHGYGAPRFDTGRHRNSARNPDTGIERRRLARRRLGHLRRLCPLRQICRWRRAMCRPNWRRARRTACSRSKSSASVGLRGFWPSRLSIRPERECVGSAAAGRPWRGIRRRSTHPEYCGGSIASSFLRLSHIAASNRSGHSTPHSLASLRARGR